jgi:glutamate formiminotransferase/formiminotetrahydrofolate cyclodeaminase
MTNSLVECVPNFSEGRRQNVLEEIRLSISSVPGTIVLDTHSDPDHNRSVITFVGSPEAVEEAAFQMIRRAAELIDMNEHSGEHPRLGATDVVPFVPISNISMEECVELAYRVGNRVAEELNIPIYYYENAAKTPERRRLELIRKGEFEALKKDISDVPERAPDAGPKQLGSAGATVIGAREFLIAYNVNLTTDQEEIADKIARTIRHSSGGLRYVKALGMMVEGRAQVSMNLTNFRKTSLPLVVESIRREAGRYGVEIHNSELVGLIPQEALVDAAVWYTQMDLFSPEQVLEQRMAAVTREGTSLDFCDELAAGTAVPGGGSASAYASAMGASLVSMVARLSIGKKDYQDVEKELSEVLDQSEKFRKDLRTAVQLDADAFSEVMDAYKMPKTDPKREKFIQQATLKAAEVPLSVAEKSVQVIDLALTCARIGNKNAITDAGAGANLAWAGLMGAAYNVRINLSSLTNKKKIKEIQTRISKLEDQADQILKEVQQLLSDRGGI